MLCGRVAIALLAPVIAACARDETVAREREPEHPDIVIVVADDLSWRELDELQTPVIDRLAASGVRFEGLYGASPTCSPFRGSLLFGIRPDRVSIGRPVLPTQGNAKHPDLIRGDNPAFPVHLLSIADLARVAGYRTAAFGKCHLGNAAIGQASEYMRMIGFDDWLAGSIFGVRNYGQEGPRPKDYARVDNGVISRETKYNPTAITEAVVEWWAKTPGPRFAYVAHNLPHAPFHYPTGEGPPSNRAKYKTMVRELDRQIGTLLEGIGFWEAQDEILFAFVSDNGTPPDVVGEERSARVKGSVYEDGMRVPAIFAGASVAGPGRRTPPTLIASSTDYAATFAELWGLAVPRGAAQDSRSFLAVLEDAEVDRARDLVFAQHWEPNGRVTEVKDPCLYMVRRWDGLKLVRDGMVSEPDAGSWSVFELAADPDEQNPLDLSRAPELRRALEERARW